MSSAYIVHRPGKPFDYLVVVDVRDYVSHNADWDARHAEHPEAASNASLIAASPELLQALKAILDGAEGQSAHAGMSWQQCATIARAAISKALGK